MIIVDSTTFQFLNGSINMRNCTSCHVMRVVFQFLNGSINISGVRTSSEVVESFQFLNGSINIPVLLPLTPKSSLFQFLNGSINIFSEPMAENLVFARFNSSMVRLILLLAERVRI